MIDYVKQNIIDWNTAQADRARYQKRFADEKRFLGNITRLLDR